MTTAQHASTGSESTGAPNGQSWSAIADFVLETEAFAASQLARRQAAQPLRKLLPQHVEPPLLWGAGQLSSRAESLIRLCDRLRRRRSTAEPTDWEAGVSDWLSASASSPSTVDDALIRLAWANALPRLVGRLANSTWRALLHALATAVEAVEHFDSPGEDPLVVQLTAGELPLTLAYHFPELPARRDWHRGSAEVIEHGLDSLLDGAGLLHARHLAGQRPLLACWTRCLYFDRAMKKRRVSKESRQKFAWMVRETIRWTRPDGAPFLSAEPGEDATRSMVQELFACAVETSGDRQDGILGKLVTGQRSSQRGKLKLPSPAEHSDWSQLALLRSDWTTNCAALAVRFDERDLHVELAAGRHVFLSGRQMPEVVIQGRVRQPTTEWEQICWESDDDVDYLELELAYDDDWRIQRQMLLARRDRIAFLADALLGPAEATIDYRAPLPLAAGVSLSISEETREAHVMAGHCVGTLLPLSLPEWRSGRRMGELSAGPAEFRQTAVGTALFAALFVNLDARRCDQALTWRHLTVAENLQILPPDQAVAYRVQIGTDQWIFYRSLAKPGNRTFLGANTVSEFLAGRIESDGEVSSLIDIVGEDAAP